MPVISGTNPGKIIPGIIHQFWSQGIPPDPYFTWGEKIKAMHPGWKYYLWTFETLSREFPEANLTEDMNHAIKADIARFLLLYRFGGIWLDMDMEMHRTLDSLLSNDFFISFQIDGYVGLGIVGSIPRHPLVESINKAIAANRIAIQKPKNMAEHCQIAGPGAITPLIRNGGPIKVLPTEWFYQNQCAMSKSFSVTPETYATHHYGSYDKRISWCNEYTN